MKYGIKLDYRNYLIFDADTFGKLASLLAKGEVRSRDGYGGDAKYLPCSEPIELVTLNDWQVVENIEVIEETEKSELPV